MKIAFVLEDVSLAGGHRNVFSLANHLKNRGHEVVVYAVNPLNVEWMDIQVPIIATGSYPALETALRGWDGIMIATWWRTAAPVARVANERGFYFIQDIETSYSTDPTYHEAVMATYKLGLTPFTYGKWIQDEFVKLGLGEITRIGMAVDHNLFYANERSLPNSNVVLFHERNHFLKGPQLRNEVIVKLNEHGGFTTTGYSPWSPNPFADAHLRGLSDGALAEVMRSSFAMLVTSVHEGFCLPALEAMTCGLPVVTTAADGNEEFCFHDVNCLIGKDADELTHHLKSLQEDATLWARLREGGLKTAAEYDWGTSVAKLESILE